MGQMGCQLMLPSQWQLHSATGNQKHYKLVLISSENCYGSEHPEGADLMSKCRLLLHNIFLDQNPDLTANQWGTSQ